MGTAGNCQCAVLISNISSEQNFNLVRMEACMSVEKEVDRVVTKLSSLKGNMEAGIDEQIAAIEKLQRDLAEESEMGPNISAGQRDMVRDVSSEVNKSVTRIATEHRDLHSSVSKVGKAIDRNFVADFDSTSREDVFSGPGKEPLLTEVVLQHLCREGRLDISETLTRESGITRHHIQQEPFQELNHILEALKSHDLGPALDWVAKNREALNMWGTTLLFSQVGGRQSVQQRSSLELRLHKLKFTELLILCLRAGERGAEPDGSGDVFWSCTRAVSIWTPGVPFDSGGECGLCGSPCPPEH